MNDPRTDPYANARRALSQLEAFVQQSRHNDMDRAAVIQAFEFTFETFWRAFKKIVEGQGQVAPFPRAAIAGAFQWGLIHDEDTWLDMIRDRNQTSHIYNKNISQAIYHQITSRYLKAFQDAASQQRHISPP
jgi:nucleotidyltransferase substrate binding protein (TIGR01987 family)